MATYGLSLAEIQTAVANAVGFDQNAADSLLKINQAVMAAGHSACTWRGADWWFLKDTAHFQTATKTVATVANSGCARASNVVTITTTAAHGLQAGQFVKVSSVLLSAGTTAGADGIFKVATAPTTTTFTYGNVGATIGAAAAGGGSVYVASYPLRTIDIAGAITATAASMVMPNMRAIERVYYDDDRAVEPISWHQVSYDYRMDTSSPTEPTFYCIRGEPPQLFLWPIPASAYDMYVDYIKRHPMPGLDTDLLIPGEFHWEVYIGGAVWLLRHNVISPTSLEASPEFVTAMQRMTASAPTEYDLSNDMDAFRDARNTSWPYNKKVTQSVDGSHIWNDPSL